MIEKKIFGLTPEQIRKQSGSRDYSIDPESRARPIRPGETLEPCIRGSQKIMSDPKKREMLNKIYRGK